MQEINMDKTDSNLTECINERDVRNPRKNYTEKEIQDCFDSITGVSFIQKLKNLFIDILSIDFVDYTCGCKCDLNICDEACCEYFRLQDYKPYRKVDLNIPELKNLPKERKIISYSHFQKMLQKRNRNPYYFFTYLISKHQFNSFKRYLRDKK